MTDRSWFPTSLADPRVTAEKQDQLTSVVLSVPQIVEQELANAQLVPGESAAFKDACVSQLPESFVTFPKAVIGVIK
jgi:hypothetical protein